MSQRVGPNGIEARIVRLKTAPEAKDHRVELGYRPSVVLIFVLHNAGTPSFLAVAYDGQQNRAGAANGGVLMGGNAATKYLSASDGITFEDRGFTFGQNTALRANDLRLVFVIFGPDAPEVDLQTAQNQGVLPKDGGFGSGQSYVYDPTPPDANWIGTTT